jgi:hypothetical protein
MQNQKINFPVNEPVELSLAYAEGKEVPSNFPPGSTQYMFTTFDGHVFFVSPNVAESIHALKLAPQEHFTIERKETKNGHGSAFAWDIRRKTAPASENTAPAPAPQPKPPAQAAAAQRPQPNGRPQAVPAPDLMTAESQRLARQLIAGIEAAKCAEEYGERIGRAVKFSAEDIRAITISGFIQQSRQAERSSVAA